MNENDGIHDITTNEARFAVYENSLLSCTRNDWIKSFLFFLKKRIKEYCVGY
jgi:hypothetical protein